MKELPYSTDELHAPRPQRSFTEKASEAAFLLGGIGTGNISIGARGELRDWEIFNHPGKGDTLPYSFFAIRVQKQDLSISRVLESCMQPPYQRSNGFHPNTLAGLPRLQHSILKGEYPLVKIEFQDEELPVHVNLEAYTPFVPLNPEESGIPVILFIFSIRNKCDKPVEVSVAASLMNAIGYTGVGEFSEIKKEGFGKNINEMRDAENARGLFFHSEKYDKNDLRYGNMALATLNKSISIKKQWLRGEWWDCLRDFWDDFSSDGRLDDLNYDTPSNDKGTDVGSVAVLETLNPKEEKQIRFMLSWYFPNRPKSWRRDVQVACGNKVCSCKTVRNRYAVRFDNAWDVIHYVASRFEHLDKLTRTFHDAFFSSTLPYYVLEALSANITVLRSTTCFWLEDGTFLGYEGCYDSAGCCEGNCTHVWNYAHTLAFLYPSLERDMRRTEFAVETEADGKMNFRAFRIFGEEKWRGFEPAADGQCGSIMRLYREWKLSGDDSFLLELWPYAKRAMDFVCEHWDADGDGILDGKQHNTYDIEFYGPNSLTEVMFLGALKASSRMAGAMADSEAMTKYSELFERGQGRTEDLLWNGEYYVQKLDNVDEHRYQYGQGCLSDQLLAQTNAHIMGLGYLLPEEHVKKAIRSVFRYNFQNDFFHHENCQRAYVFNDEKGLLLCTWPFGGRPKLPLVYSDEVWTGIEYHVAAHLIFEGFVNEGLTLVKAIRERHDGIKRNPWNEVECGNHYARSMSSWGLLVALSGFRFDMVSKTIEFHPVINQDDFRTFWSTNAAWGIYTRKIDKASGQVSENTEVLYGNLEGVSVNGTHL